MPFTMSYRDPDEAKPAKRARPATAAKPARAGRVRPQDKAHSEAEALFAPAPPPSETAGED